MNMQLLNPYVRFARVKENTILQGVLQAIDHRIFYCHSGCGQYEVNGILHSFTAGTCPPGHHTDTFLTMKFLFFPAVISTFIKTTLSLVLRFRR